MERLSSSVREGTPVNLASLVAAHAKRTPGKRAVVVPHGRDSRGRVAYTHLTFGQVEDEIEAFARGLSGIGIERGMKVVLMVRPGLDFLPLTYALFRLGAVPVLIDPGMGRKNLLHCIRQVGPEAFIGVPLAHLARKLFPRSFAKIRIHVTIGRRWLWGGYAMADIHQPTGEAVPAPTTQPEELAAIIFTTGSTGPPKGVEYTHGMFAAQVATLGQAFGLTSDDIDMPGFALFALYTLAMGLTVIIPDMDPTRPALVTPERIIEAVTDHGATFSFGSPALWNRVSLHCLEHGIRLPSLRGITMAGAPIPGYLHERMLGHILGGGAEIHTPYGATECLPVTSFEGSRILAETLGKTQAGAGYCVGRPLPGISLRVIRIHDEALPRWSQVEELPTGEIGEIVVQGAVVSRRYHQLPEKTRLHKIYETADEKGGPFWHRIGDAGYLDDAGRLWFCGRVAHRVVTGDATLYTVCCEALVNNHPAVYRSALVGLGSDRYRQEPVLIVEPAEGHFPADDAGAAKLREELMAIVRGNPLTASIGKLMFHRSFPVDIRHNAKIFREKLAVWAAEQPECRGGVS